MFSKKRIMVYMQIFIFLLIGLHMYILNVKTPLCNDDYSYSFTLFSPIVRVKSIRQILKGLVNHYYVQGGRIIAHFITQYMLMLGDFCFNIFNSILYLLLITGILLNSGVKFIGTIKGIIYPILVHILLFIYSPSFSESFLWLDGSANYLWTTVILLYVFLPYYNLLRKDKYRYTNFCFLLVFNIFSLISGMTNENTALAQIIMSGLIIILANRRGGYLPSNIVVLYL